MCVNDTISIGDKCDFVNLDISESLFRFTNERKPSPKCVLPNVADILQVNGIIFGT
jgi:hypothetical protein